MDPYAVLGVERDADRDEVRDAWRALVKALHPDRRAGDTPQSRADAERRLSEVNAAYHVLLAVPATAPPAPGGADPAGPAGSAAMLASFAVASFRPVVFEALMVTAADLGDVTDTDEPFSLVIHVEGPPTGFCRLELFPDAGGSIVSADSDQVDPAWVSQVLVAGLNRLGIDAVALPG